MGSGCSTHSLLPQTDTPSAKPGPGPGHHSARIASTTNTGGGSQEIPSEETAIETFDKENTMKQLKQDKAARRAEREKNGEVARSPSHSHGARSRDRSRERSSHKSHRERSDRGGDARSRERSRDRGSGAPSRSRPHDSDEEMEDHEHQSHRKSSRRNKKDRDQDKHRDREEKRRDDHDRAASPLQFIQPNHIDTGGGDGDDEMEVMELDHKLPDTHNNNNHNNHHNKPIKPAQPSYKPPAASLLKKGLVDRNFAQESSNAEIFVQLSRDRLKAGLPAAPASSGWT